MNTLRILALGGLLLGFLQSAFAEDLKLWYEKPASEWIESHAGSVQLFPALPSALYTGSVKGLRAQGVFEVDLEWKEGTLERASIKSFNGNNGKVSYKGKLMEFETAAGQEYRFDGDLRRI